MRDYYMNKMAHLIEQEFIKQGEEKPTLEQIESVRLFMYTKNANLEELVKKFLNKEAV